MSGTSPRRADPIARDARPLPATPHLEYERKQAKALLKQLHAGDPDAVRRVQAAHPAALRDTGVEALQLADAQHVIAREYGFTSWPRMVEYFEVLERHRHAPRFSVAEDGLARFEGLARNVVTRHERGDQPLWRASSPTSSPCLSRGHSRRFSRDPDHHRRGAARRRAAVSSGELGGADCAWRRLAAPQHQECLGTGEQPADAGRRRHSATTTSTRSRRCWTRTPSR